MPVYFIQAGEIGHVKIGHATNVATRLRELQTANSAELRLLRTIAGGFQEEAWFHEYFSHYRVRGEWFEFHAGMLTVMPSGDLPAVARTTWARPDVIRRVLDAAGSASALARHLNVTPQAVSNWSRVPAEKVRLIEAVIEGAVRCYEMRPDVYPPAEYAIGGPYYYEVPRQREAL